MIGWPDHFTIRLKCDVNYPKSHLHYKAGTELNVSQAGELMYQLTVVTGKKVRHVRHFLIPVVYCDRIGR
jgi:hypothetical protein